MIIFLDFDGVLHNTDVFVRSIESSIAANLQEHERKFLTNKGKLVDGESLFEHAERLALVLESFPDIRIVITSTWRLHFTLDSLKEFLPKPLADRVIGVTPQLFTISGNGVTLRSREISRYLQINCPADQQWIALDDTDYLFFGYGDNPHLFLIDGKRGFTDTDAVVLEQWLRNLPEVLGQRLRNLTEYSK